MKIRATHPYSYRSGEWAELLTTAPGPDRDCYVVQFPDGATDFWVVDDPHANSRHGRSRSRIISVRDRKRAHPAAHPAATNGVTRTRTVAPRTPLMFHQLTESPSSSGPGSCSFTAGARVQIPLGIPAKLRRPDRAEPSPRSKPVIKSVLTALAFTRYAIKSTLANAIGRMVLTTLAAAASAFATVDILSSGDWLAACQVILLGAFSIAGASLLYLAGRTDEMADRNTRPTA